MSNKAPLKIIKSPITKERYSADAKLSSDCTCFSIRIEGGKPTAWVDFLYLVMSYASEEIKALKMAPDKKTH
jgi:hypothetical protein